MMPVLLAARPLDELKEQEEALQRWEGEGGLARDSFGLRSRIQDQLQRWPAFFSIQVALWSKAFWPGWSFGPDGRLTPPPRVRRSYVDFQDYTNPSDRSFGFYLIKVPAWEYSQIIRASHATAARLARSRTQYGDAELHFLEEIDTPALD